MSASIRDITAFRELMQRLSNIPPRDIWKEYTAYFYQYWYWQFSDHGRFSGYLFEKWLNDHRQTLEEIGGVGHSVLDIGCGCGFSSLAYYYSGASNVIGIDSNHGYINAFGHLLRDVGISDSSVAIVKCDIQKNRFDDGSFEALIVNESLSHINFVSLDKLFSEFRRILKPEGMLYLKDGNNLIYHLINPIALWRYRKLLLQSENEPISRRRSMANLPEDVMKWGDDYSEDCGGPGYKDWSFREVRRWYIQKHFTQMPEETVEKLAIATQGLHGRKILEAAQEYIISRKLPLRSPYNCVNPITGEMVERRFNPYTLIRTLKKVGFTSEFLPLVRPHGDEKGLKRMLKRFLKDMPGVLNGLFPVFRIIARKNA